MPCLCPQSAPSSAALWITDDVLAAAWRRFTHVYNNTHSQRHRIDGGRRHGSNVPGPLEARRRLAKRRMGLASHAQPSNGGFAGDFGALFGFGTRGATRQDVEKGWKWEAPKTQQRDVTGSDVEGSVLGYGWPGGKPKRKEEEHTSEAWERFLQMPTEEAGIDEDVDAGNAVEDVFANSSGPNDAQVDPVLASGASFDQLLANLEGVKRLKTDDITEVVAFLQSSTDEPEAKNCLKLLQWLGGRGSVSNKVLDLVMDVIVNKIRLAALPTDDSAYLLKHLAVTLQSASPDYTRMHDVLRAVPDYEMLTEVCTTTTRLLLDDVPASQDELAPVIDMWLSCLHSYSKEATQPSFDLVWRAVYQELSERYTCSAVLRKHLSALDSELLAVILLHSWVPHVLATSRNPDLGLGGEKDSGTSGITQLSTGRQLAEGSTYDSYGNHLHTRPSDDTRTNETFRSVSNIGYKTRGRSTDNDILRLSFSRPTPTHITRIVKSWTIFHSKSSLAGSPHSALVDLLATLARHRLPWAAFACDIFSILSYPSSPAANSEILYAYRRVRTQLSLGIPSVLGAQLVNHFLSTNSLRYALHVFRSVPGLPLSQFHPLAIAIAEDSSKVPSSAIWDVLNRIAPEDYTPRPALGIATQPLIIPDSHVDLVHRVAFAFAKQEHLPPRKAFRRVWECYRFLKDRSAPVGSLISRALVTAGVIRPLKMGVRVSTEELRFTLSVVEKVEGKDVAAQLDRKVLEIWQGSVLPQMLNANCSGIEEESFAEKGADRWRSIAWAQERNGRNNKVYARQRAEIEEPDVTNRYEPFASDDGAGGISKSLPRAGADSWDVSASSKVQNEERASSLWASEVGDARDALWLNEMSFSADMTPSMPPVSPVRHGLGYSNSIKEQHETSRAKGTAASPKSNYGYLDEPFVTTPDSSQGSRSTINDYHGLENQNVKSGELIASLENIYAVEEPQPDVAAASTPVKARLNRKSAKTSAKRAKIGMASDETSISAGTTEQWGEPSATIKACLPFGKILTEDAECGIAGARRMERHLQGDPPAQLVAAPSSPETTQDAVKANNLTEQDQTLAGYFPLLWQGEPQYFFHATYLVRRFKKSHVEQPPTSSESSFMQSYDAALCRIFDDGELKKGATAFPFQWGGVCIDENLGHAVRDSLAARAYANGREIEGEERVFVTEWNRLRRRRIKARREAVLQGLREGGERLEEDAERERG